jgi:probable HAF family extracellular repeat protein
MALSKFLIVSSLLAPIRLAADRVGQRGDSRGCVVTHAILLRPSAQRFGARRRTRPNAPACRDQCKGDCGGGAEGLERESARRWPRGAARRHGRLWRSCSRTWPVGNGAGAAWATAHGLRSGQHLGQGAADPPGGGEAEARDINNSGQVVGWGTTESGHKHAFKRELLGSTLDIGSTYQSHDTIAEGINDNAEVVGYMEAGHTRAFYWSSGGGFVDLSNDNPPGVEGARAYVATAVSGDFATAPAPSRTRPIHRPYCA